MSPAQDFSSPSFFDDATDPQESVIPQAASGSIPAPDGDNLPIKPASAKNNRPKLSRTKVTSKSVPAVAGNQKMANGRDEPAYLSARQLAKRYSVGIATIWRWAKTIDGFPKPIELTPGTTRWAVIDLLVFEQHRRGL